MTVFTVTTDDSKTRLRPHISHLRLQLVAVSADPPRQNRLREFPNRAKAGHGRKMESEND